MAEVSDDVKSVVNEIIKNYKLNPASKITYGPGSEIRDGFLSKTYAVDINSNGKESINLFLKCVINVKIPGAGDAGDIYENEIYFYETIIPAFMKFLKEKGIGDGFQNVPHCYGSVPKKIVALENLRKCGYELCDKDLVANEQHIELVFRTYAKFHAISFAYKDQRRDGYDKLKSGMGNFLQEMPEGFRQQQVHIAETALNDFFKSLDSREDKFILDQFEFLKNKLIEHSKTSFEIKSSDNTVIVQGDCWCNNMMFKYEGDKRYPSTVMLVDWQAVRVDTPVLDLSYFFYTSAASCKQTLERIDEFLEIYHEELSNQIRKMGSDPDVLYPLPVLKKEWKKYCNHGFSMAFFILKVMLGEQKDMPSFEGKDITDALCDMSAFPVDARQDEYINRLRNLAQHFLINEFL